MKLGRLVQILATLLVMSMPVHAGIIDMSDEDGRETNIDDTTVIGCDIDSTYYTVVIDDGRIQKIEYNGTEDPEFTIETDWETLFELVSNYNEMGWLEKIRFLIKELKIPIRYIMMFDNIMT